MATTSFCSAVLTGVLTTAFTGGVAQAQDTAPKADAAAAEEPVQEVIVTGSRIRRNVANAPAPLIQITQEDILQSGQPNIIDQLADIPALTGSYVPEDTTGSNLNDGGLSLLNLRQLGSGRTLVLVDGKRHVGAQQGSLAVDVDTIPRLLIERIELITGGQSAMYGADAVSGVVNYIMKDDFEGLIVDGNLSQINQGGQSQKRISALWGKNFFDNRLNVYGSYEHEENDEVKDSDVDWRRRACGLYAMDADVNAGTPDGVYDNQLLCGVRNFSRPYTGLLVVASGLQTSPASDPDIAASLTACTPPATSATNKFPTTAASNTNCFFANEKNAYVFSATGAARLLDIGSSRVEVGGPRSNAIGGDGLNIGTEFSQGSRIPQSNANRLQGGFNFKVNDYVTAYGEAKYVKEETYDDGQGSFFNIGLYNVPANSMPQWTPATSSFNIGLDNAYLDPAVRTIIQNNLLKTYDKDGNLVSTSTTVDARAMFTNFGPLRNQLNFREAKRYVLGAKGQADEFLFAKDIAWEASYVYGELKNENHERGLDVERYRMGADAVVDTAGKVHGKPGEIVCRSQLLAANGYAIADPYRGGNVSPTDPKVTGCVPFNIFGNGQNDPAARAYYDAEIQVSHTNKQQHFLAYGSGNLWDFWGAGPIGAAMGVEWRKEEAEGKGRTGPTGDRILFLNTGADFPYSHYEVKEAFAELQLPLLKNLPFVKSLEFSGAARTSDYTTVGKVDTWSTQFMWEINDEYKIRGTRGKAVRVPTLSENFSLQSQTFASITDPCDAVVISNTTDPKTKENRIKNCAALGIPAGTSITYTSTVGGFNGGNPFLKPETSVSRTLSFIAQPKFLPRTTFVFDWYNIEIRNAIASVTAQTLANQCVGGDVLNSNACGLIARDPTNYRINWFLQGSLNYAKLETQGMDFTVTYRQPLDSVFGKNLGQLNFSLRGNYEQWNREYTNIDAPLAQTDYTQSVGAPQLRFATNVAWRFKPDLSFFWNMDFQSSQEIADIDLLRSDSDNREYKFLTTGDYIQHDFSVRWDIKDNLLLRAGIVNAFDADPVDWLGQTTADNFDLFGRRFYVGFQYKR
nr:TonB-dependent receptor [Asticcacaulis aquaticus]